MTDEELGAQLELSASRIARLFKAEMGMSLVEYRNRLRLERFSSLLDEKGENLHNWFAGIEIAGITASLAHAQSFGDLWLDTFVEVGAYARAKQMFEALTPSNNTWTWTLPAHFPPGKVLRVRVDGGTLRQGSTALAWDSLGYYEVSLDAKTLSWSP